MFRKLTLAVLTVGAACVLTPWLACSPSFEFPEHNGGMGGATTSMGGSLVATSTDGQEGGGAGLGGEAGAMQSSTDAIIGGSGGRPDFPYDTGDEDCRNGVDDDDDGAIDCQDDDCAPFYRCLPPVPEGWQGPVAILETSADNLPGCMGAGYYPLGLETIGRRVLSDPEPSICPTCTCEPPEGATCTTANVSYFNSPDCTGDPKVVAAGETCASDSFPHDGVNVPASAMLDPPSAGGMCTPVETGSASTPAADRVRVRSCAPNALDAGGCDESESCLPLPRAPFSAAVCIFTEGEVDCPQGYDTPTERYYGSEFDSRSCLTCSCRSPKCTGAASDYVNDVECGGSATEIAPGECVSIDTDDTDPNTRSFAWDVSVATCEPRSGPSGMYALSDPLTYCCAAF